MSQLAFDLGGTSLRAALFDQSGHEIAYWKQPTKDFKSALEAFKAAIHFFHGKNIERICIGAPDIDTQSGAVKAHNLPWPHFNIKDIIKDELDLPLLLFNDADLQALALARELGERTSAIVLTLGTGVGFSLIDRGKVFFSPLGLEGGHIYVGGDERCPCGGLGHLEAYLGAKSILRQASLLGHGVTSMRPLAELARSGNQDLLKFFASIGEKLGLALASMISTLGVPQIILSGGVASCHDLILPQARQTLQHHLFPPFKSEVKINLGSLPSDRVGLLGAFYAMNQD